MGRRKLSPVEKAQRVLRRDDARQEKAEKVGRLETWFQQRAAAAEERKVKARDQREILTPAQERAQAYDVVQPAVEFYMPPLGTYRGVEANYRDRRAMGQRGRQRKPRARELPGAEARRLERNRQSWL